MMFSAVDLLYLNTTVAKNELHCTHKNWWISRIIYPRTNSKFLVDFLRSSRHRCLVSAELAYSL
jgi:hypothetical protein